MLYVNARKDALEIHKRAVEKYDRVWNESTEKCEALYTKRAESVTILGNVSTLINSIANSPKDFLQKMEQIEKERLTFRQTEEYAQETYDAAVRSGTGAAAGIAGGTAIASLGPSAAMWVATTFGTASTGTAISSLSGAAATKAALAWLGGGALTQGGAGIAGGQALLALAGPLGWGIAGVSALTSVTIMGIKNKQVSFDAIEEAKKITVAGALLNESNTKISKLICEIKYVLRKTQADYKVLVHLAGADYRTLQENDQIRLGSLVNLALSLAELLNRSIDSIDDGVA